MVDGNAECSCCGDIVPFDDAEQCNRCGRVFCYHCSDALEDHNCVADSPVLPFPVETIRVQ